MMISIAVLIVVLLGAAMLGVSVRYLIPTLHDFSQLRREYEARELKAVNTPPPSWASVYSPHEIAYIENALKQVIEELKKGAYLRQDFRFDTKAEREAYAEKLIDNFLAEDQETTS